MNHLRGAKFVWQTFAILFILSGALSSVAAQNILLRANSDPATTGGTSKYADLWGDGNLAVMGSFSSRGAWIYDISNPNAPVLKSYYNPTPAQQFLEAIVVGNRGYFGSGNNGSGGGGVHIVDLSNPSNPVLLGRVTAANGGGYDTIHEMVVDGDYLYINSNTTSNRNLKVINISNPAQPRFVRDIVPINPGWVHAVHIKNGRMYTSGFFGTGLTEIYDITSIETQAPRLLGQVVTGTSSHSSWTSEDGNFLYVAREFFDGELRVYNISNPASPQLIKIIKAADLGINAICPHNPMVKGNLLYVSWYQGGVQVFDITNGADPKRISQYDTYATAYNEDAAREEMSNLGAEPWDVVCGREELLDNLPSGFNGNWTAFPLLGHDKVLLSDLATGFYVVDASGALAAPRNKIADFDGDGKTDISVFRPSNGNWYYEGSNGGFRATVFGANGDRIMPADYDGDGKTDFAVARQTNGSNFFYILNSSDNSFRAEQFGATSDLPVAGDFDSDGRADLAVFRPSNAAWYIRNSTLGFRAVNWGASGDEPVTGDFDGDGKTDIAVVRATNNLKYWYILPSSWTTLQARQFGAASDKTVIGDFDGDARTDTAVFRSETGTWYVNNSQNNSLTAVQFGAAEDLPVPADYDGDARSDIMVFRPSNGTWYGLRSSNGSFFGKQFGVGTDVPAPVVAQPRRTF